GLGLLLRTAGATLFDFARCFSPRPFESARASRPRRRRRTTAPDRVDRIGVDRHQFCADRRAGFSQFVGLLGRVKPWIVPDLVAFLEVLFEPLLGGMLHEMLDRKNISIDLLICLHGVAAIDK